MFAGVLTELLVVKLCLEPNFFGKILIVMVEWRPYFDIYPVGDLDFEERNFGVSWTFAQ